MCGEEGGGRVVQGDAAASLSARRCPRGWEGRWRLCEVVNYLLEILGFCLMAS